MVKHLFSLYHQVVNKMDAKGVLQYQFTIDVDKLMISEYPRIEELRTQLKITKIIEKEIKTTYIQFPALDENIKVALSDMYTIVEEFKLREDCSNIPQ